MNLFISKLDNDQFLEKEQINVAALLQDSLSNFQLLTDSSGITTSKEIKTCVLFNNKNLIEVLINNLLRNAYQHNVPNGRVSVKLNDHEMMIINTGEPSGVPSDQLFKRFVKGKVGSYGIGLGLSIAEKICRLSGYTIKHSYSNELHFFTVVFLV